MIEFSITAHHARAEEMHDLHEIKFKESQLLRIEAIAALKESGLALIKIREGLKEATKNNPVTTELGTFSSFSDYLNRDSRKISATYAYKYIKLAENWDIVESLGMQDTTDEKTLAKSMRLSRTLRIIDWYKLKLDNGYNREDLTLDLYWQEQDSPSHSERPSYRQLQAEVSSLKAVIELQNKQLAELSSLRATIKVQEEQLVSNEYLISELRQELESYKLTFA